MKASRFVLAIVATFFIACNNNSKSVSSILKKETLPSQLFAVNITRDTTLVTKQGCLIRLPKGCLQSDNAEVKLEVKEALSSTDIVLAGLTTMSDGQPLSSGGMIYINAAAGYQVSIKKEIEILVPSKNYNPDMQVFKGEEKNDGSINWTEPTPLPEDSTLLKIDNGKALFKANCASCHKIETDFTGPALAFVTDRRPKQWLYAFTRNPMAMIESGYYTNGTTPGTTQPKDTARYDIFPDHYGRCLFNKWNKVQMTAFANLTDGDLDALYSYIKTESEKLPRPAGTNNVMDCCDSCETYRKAADHILSQLSKYKMAQDTLFTLDRIIPVPPPDTIFIKDNSTQNFPDRVRPDIVMSTFYTINIKAFGWYNIDMLMKDFSACEPSQLFVRLQGSYEVDMNVTLIIPSVKAFVEGGKLNDGKQYGFDDTNGNIPLPQNREAYIIAFAEKDDKLLFSKKSFITQKNQTIDLSFTEISREQLKTEIRSLNLDGVKAEVKETKNGKEIRNLNSQLKEAEKLKPKNCDCGSETINTSSIYADDEPIEKLR